jgi:type III pantothenate kinase
MANKTLNLCIDIGNTRFKIALFEGDEVIEMITCNKQELTPILNKLVEIYPVKAMIVSTTRKSIPKKIRIMGSQFKNYIELSDQTKVPINIEYRTPETLGRDRIAASVGANFLYPGEGNIVVDAGTCVTYDYISKEGSFLGGNISPGINMRMKAMNAFTSNLPLVELQSPSGILGQSTEEALQNGSIKGTIYEIDSFIREIENKYGKSKVILTGGDADYFVDYFKSKIFVVQNLVLIGLNKIIQHNA